MKTNATTQTVGLILAGGRSTRMGGTDKALVTISGSTLLERSIEALRPQANTLLINSNQVSQGIANHGLPVVTDVLTGYLGPLAGIHAGLKYAPDSFICTIAVDLAQVPSDLIERLRNGMGNARCAYATDGHHHALAILWAPGTVTLLEEYLASGERSIKKFLANHGAPVRFDRPDDAGLFHNINSPADLHAAELKYAESPGA